MNAYHFRAEGPQARNQIARLTQTINTHKILYSSSNTDTVFAATIISPWNLARVEAAIAALPDNTARFHLPNDQSEYYQIMIYAMVYSGNTYISGIANIFNTTEDKVRHDIEQTLEDESFKSSL